MTALEPQESSTILWDGLHDLISAQPRRNKRWSPSLIENLEQC